MLDLSLLRIRSLAVANVLTLIGAAGFYAYVLCNVLFLTSVWGYSVLQAGLAITPGPFIAAAVAGPAGKLADRIGPRWVLVVGGAIWAAGVAMLINRVGLEPDFLSEWLPAMIVLGIGAGITFPVVGAAAVASVSGGRFATATGLNSIARQLGAVLGVSILVAIIGTPSPAEVADAFDRGWTFAAACFIGCAVGALLLGPVERAEAEPEERREAAEPTPAGPYRGPSRAARSVHSTRLCLHLDARTPQEVLRMVPIFAELPEASLSELASRAATVRIEAGDTLFRQGDPADSLYVVVSGRLEVLLEKDEPEVLRVLGPETVVGDLALLADTARSATIRARRDTELLQLKRHGLRATDGGGHGLHRRARTADGTQLQRSRELESPAATPASTIAIVAGTDHPGFDAICGALVDGLAACGRTIRVDPAAGRGGHSPGTAARALRGRVRPHRARRPSARPVGRASACIKRTATALVAAGTAVSETVQRMPELRGCDLLFSIEPGAGRRRSHTGATRSSRARST